MNIYIIKIITVTEAYGITKGDKHPFDRIFTLDGAFKSLIDAQRHLTKELEYYPDSYSEQNVNYSLIENGLIHRAEILKMNLHQ